MKAQNSQEAPKKESSFLQEQAKYWKAFVGDLFVGTLKRMTLSPLVF